MVFHGAVLGKEGGRQVFNSLRSRLPWYFFLNLHFCYNIYTYRALHSSSNDCYVYVQAVNLCVAWSGMLVKSAHFVEFFATAQFEDCCVYKARPARFLSCTSYSAAMNTVGLLHRLPNISFFLMQATSQLQTAKRSNRSSKPFFIFCVLLDKKESKHIFDFTLSEPMLQLSSAIYVPRFSALESFRSTSVFSMRSIRRRWLE